MRYLSIFLGFVFSMIILGCDFGPLDAMGEEAAVANIEELIKDDSVLDKNPKYDPSRTITEVFPGGCEIILNKSATVTRLDIVPLEGNEKVLEGRLFSDRGSAIAAILKIHESETTLTASMEVVNGALKPFNDGLYAAVELGVQSSKVSFLTDLLAAVTVNIGDAQGSVQRGFLEAAAVDLGAALILAGETPTLSSKLRSLAEAAVKEFTDKGALFSRPIGFYTWNKKLKQIFAQDRFLQNYQGERSPYSDEEVGKAAALALTLKQDATLAERYQKHLALYAGLTNPFANHPVSLLMEYVSNLDSLNNISEVTKQFLADFPSPDLVSQECQPHFALFPSSRSKETEYFESRYCSDGAPAGVNYMEELVKAIRDGQLNLAPTNDSGWYDYQSFALETLLLPERADESKHLLLTKAYKEKLLETFKTIMTQNRETHAKQLEMGKSDIAAMVVKTDLYPLFPAEPFPTFYLRSARAYRFLIAYLSSVLDAKFLSETSRLYEGGGSSKLSLGQELHEKAELLYGLYFQMSDAVGAKPELLPKELEEFNEDSCREAAKKWLGISLDSLREETWFADSDVLKDSRVLVPVQRDILSKEVVYWGVIGVKVLKSNVEFVKGSEPRDIVSACWTKEIKDHNYYLLAEQFAEITLPGDVPPPTRDEFRAACDEHDNAKDIEAALSAK